MHPKARTRLSPEAHTASGTPHPVPAGCGFSLSAPPSGAARRAGGGLRPKALPGVTAPSPLPPTPAPRPP